MKKKTLVETQLPFRLIQFRKNCFLLDAFTSEPSIKRANSSVLLVENLVSYLTKALFRRGYIMFLLFLTVTNIHNYCDMKKHLPNLQDGPDNYEYLKDSVAQSL